jgi:hypothetical protein
MRVPIVPFLRPSAAAVSHGGWFLTTVNGDTPLPAEITHWDYQTVLELAAPVSVDRETVTQGCDLEWDSGLAVLVTARSSHTNAEVLAQRLEVPARKAFDLAVEVSLEGSSLGGRLTLETLLVATDPKPKGPLAPQEPGSILWRTKHWTDLEGMGAQFPTDTGDFSQTSWDGRAGWELRIDLSDPEARFMSAARLTLNSGNPAIARLLKGERDDRTDQLLRTLNWDITRQIVVRALETEEVIGHEVDAEAVSVVGVMRNLLAVIWPHESVITLKRWRESEPSRLEVRIQHHCGLLP